MAGSLAGAGIFAVFGMGAVYLVISVFYAGGFLTTLGVGGRRYARVATGGSCGATWSTGFPILGHAGVARLDLAGAARQSDRVPVHQWLAALRRAQRLPYRPDRARHPGGELRDRLAGRLDRGQPRRPLPAPGADDDRFRARLVRIPARLRAYAGAGDRPPRAGVGRLRPGAEPGADVGAAAAQRRRTLSRPGDGGAHAGDLRRAAGPAHGRIADRPDRLSRNGVVVFPGRHRLDHAIALRWRDALWPISAPANAR